MQFKPPETLAILPQTSASQRQSLMDRTHIITFVFH
jgi:hypothetical protein